MRQWPLAHWLESAQSGCFESAETAQTCFRRRSSCRPACEQTPPKAQKLGSQCLEFRQGKVTPRPCGVRTRRIEGRHLQQQQQQGSEQKGSCAPSRTDLAPVAVRQQRSPAQPGSNLDVRALHASEHQIHQESSGSVARCLRHSKGLAFWRGHVLSCTQMHTQGLYFG
jgi:hypothetical protein